MWELKTIFSKPKPLWKALFNQHFGELIGLVIKAINAHGGARVCYTLEGD